MTETFVAAPSARRTRPFNLAAAAIVLVWLATACLWNYYPPLPATRSFTVELGGFQPGTSEPLVVAGETGAADFLYLSYVDATHVAIGYDHWGSGGPHSAPLAAAPGSHHRLDIVLPSLNAVRGNPFIGDPHLTVAWDGHTVLDETVNRYVRRPMRLWFALNPVGGSGCGPSFHGRLLAADGRPLAGNVRTSLTRGERLLGWFRYGIWQVATVAALSLIAGWLFGGTGATARRRVAAFARQTGTAIRLHPTFVVAGLAATLLAACFITYGSWKLRYPDAFGNFYDYQAQSFLGGRLDVPEAALSGEAFLSRGKVYGYFGVTPALLRVPLAIFGLGFGEVTRPSLLLAYATTLLGSYLVLLAAARTIRPGLRIPDVAVVIYTAAVGLGSTVFFLNGRAYVYHEAIAWGIAFAVWTGWFTLRHLAAPDRRQWIGALGCGVLSVHARPPAGLYALTLLGCVAAVLVWRERRRTSAALRHAAIGAACVAGVFSFNVVSYLKFQTFEGCPLRLNVQYTPERLARIGGKQFHLVNIPFVSAVYFVYPGLRTTPEFPWLAFARIPDSPAKARAKMDLVDVTTSLPCGMAGLTALCLFGGVAAWAVSRTARPALFTTWAAAVPMTLALCAAIATAQRYTGDFCPFLITAAALGLAGACAVPRRAARAVLLAGFAAATLAASVIMLALTERFQGELIWGIPDGVQARYHTLQERLKTWEPAHRAP